MEVKQGRIPPGPPEKYGVSDDLLDWMGRQFELFGNIFKASVYETSVYATRDVEFAHHVLVENWENYAKGQIIKRVALLLGNGLMVSKGNLWKRQRRMIQPAFTHESIAPLMQMISGVNSALLSKWQLAARRNEGVNVTRDASGVALEVVLRFILGEDYERVGSHFDLLTQEQARNMQFALSFRALGKIIREVIDRRREHLQTSGDALGMLMEARDPESGQLMPDNQLIDEILTLIVAGHETTASTLSWAWYLISQHPEVEQKLSSELNTLKPYSELSDLPRFLYTRQIIDEVMRLYPAGWLLTRRALGDDHLGKYFVPAGTEIYIPLYFIQRHPDLWEEPNRFNPDRFRSDPSKQRHRLATFPFSAGPRNCIGALFARIEMQIHLMTIAKCLRLRFAPSGPVELDADVNLRSKYDFIMYPEMRQSLS
ncbi:MAG TPA: cytochrome P450 [Terriglobales bacterium]|jgi:cytochrome P450|nr:cytochrome P450 [Terriglobales bacterium]